jgi:2-keto-4-pentenoate hydratase/2-oxohepta-3-ene-1,7-dioic acid hydratase in catechol pathway
VFGDGLQTASVRIASRLAPTKIPNPDPTMTSYLFTPPAVQSLPIRGKQERFPINRIFCVGRNYHAHAVEMGRPVDKSV